MIVVCFKWATPGYRTNYTAVHVNRLRSMVWKHYSKPLDFVCVTDDPKDLHPDIRVVPMWNDLCDVPPPNGIRSPNCYRRLKLFSQEAEKLIGQRFVTMDLDCVVTGDLTPIFDRREDFVIWGEEKWMNGSMMMLTAGKKTEVWEKFNPKTSPQESSQRGSDQGWIAHLLGQDVPKWSGLDGIYNHRDLLKNHAGRLPSNARVVFFNGKVKPWDRKAIMQSPWIERHAC